MSKEREMEKKRDYRRYTYKNWVADSQTRRGKSRYIEQGKGDTQKDTDVHRSSRTQKQSHTYTPTHKHRHRQASE